MTDYPVYCGGKFIKTPHAFDIVNPYTKKVFATSYLAGLPELELDG